MKIQTATPVYQEEDIPQWITQNFSWILDIKNILIIFILYAIYLFFIKNYNLKTILLPVIIIISIYIIVISSIIKTLFR
jgi:hypothetical protein